MLSHEDLMQGLKTWKVDGYEMHSFTLYLQDSFSIPNGFTYRGKVTLHRYNPWGKKEAQLFTKGDKITLVFPNSRRETR